MNPGIFVCVLGLLICHATICVGVPQLEGDCTLDNIAPEDRSECVRIYCFRKANGDLRTGKIGCEPSYEVLPGNKCTLVEHKELTYPNCCPKLICD